MIRKYIDYRANVEKKQTNQAPKRIIFYRDSVSEGQFRQVLEKELPLIQGWPALSAGVYRLLIQIR
jgi:eukaryotic translation initiation factor 2C